MEKKDRNALLSILVVLIVGAAIGWVGSWEGGDVAGFPVFALAVFLAFAMQWLAFIPAYLLRTELFYDLTGSITYVTVTTVAVLLAPAYDGRSFLLLALIVVWAARLGTYLFRRILRTGKDDRFDTIKKSFLRFLMTWTLQGLWVSFTAAAAWAAITSTERRTLGVFAIVGAVIWAFGFAFEAIADYQKSRFLKDPDNHGDFIHEGLWSWSRHPNYFGEITQWVGIAVIAVPVLQGWQYATLISPVFVAFLIIRVSGVPKLEEKADGKWGGQKDYEAYKERTPILIPRPPRGGPLPGRDG